MTRIYYDTEFIDDGDTIELISIGMVNDKGEEYYGINADLSLWRLRSLSWHMENTIPSLPIALRPGDDIEWVPEHSDWPKVRSKTRIRDDVYDFLKASKENPKDDIELWAWFGAYDHVVLAQLWGPMVNLPVQTVPMYTNDLKQEMTRKEKLGHPRLRFDMPMMSEGTVHNALDDARLLKKRYEWLEQF